jgi:hypothetical protein
VRELTSVAFGAFPAGFEEVAQLTFELLMLDWNLTFWLTLWLTSLV